ncbi:hypothetical protein FQN52_008559 [Onygenales sp. PD_12]|nr:hypothetical protein FQN52_008559 [Onygenales sp. PD_12]
MSDLDADLLALAGDDSSSDEEIAPFKSKNASPPEASANDRGESEESGEVSRKGAGKHTSRTKRARNPEDGRADFSSPSSRSRNSLRSASMSESDSDASPPPDDQGPIFPYEKLFYSVKDKAEVMAMPEIQREQLLSERAQQVDRHSIDAALRRLLASREREEARTAEKKKRKAGATDLEESQRKSSRQKTTLGGRKVGEASDAIEAYKRQREQKGKRDEQRRREANSKKKSGINGSPDGAVSDEDANGESDVEWDEGHRRRSPSVPKDDPPAELGDIQRACPGRSYFRDFCFYPGFEEATINCYVRVVVGVDETQQNVYRVCLIKKFVEGKPYAMEAKNGRVFSTPQYAVLAHGKAEKPFPFIAFSDSPITEKEFNRYRQTMAVENCKMATKSMINAKVADIKRVEGHQLTPEELDQKLRRQGIKGDGKTQAYQLMQLNKRREEATAAGDEAAIAKLNAEIEEFTGAKLAFGTSLVKPRPAGQTQQERLAELNRRNQKLNAENVRRAELAERRRARLTAAAVARGEAVADRFARVKTRARTHYDASGDRLVPKGNGSDVSRPITPITGANTPNAKAATASRTGTPSGLKNETKPHKGVPVIRHRPTDDENIAALDFEIDIEI